MYRIQAYNAFWYCAKRSAAHTPLTLYLCLHTARENGQCRCRLNRCSIYMPAIFYIALMRHYSKWRQWIFSLFSRFHALQDEGNWWEYDDYHGSNTKKRSLIRHVCWLHHSCLWAYNTTTATKCSDSKVLPQGHAVLLLLTYRAYNFPTSKPLHADWCYDAKSTIHT